MTNQNNNLNNMATILITDQESYIKLAYITDCKNWTEVELKLGELEIIGGLLQPIENYGALCMTIFNEEIDEEDFEFDIVGPCPINEILNQLD